MKYTYLLLMGFSLVACLPVVVAKDAVKSPPSSEVSASTGATFQKLKELALKGSYAEIVDLYCGDVLTVHDEFDAYPPTKVRDKKVMVAAIEGFFLDKKINLLPDGKTVLIERSKLLDQCKSFEDLAIFEERGVTMRNFENLMLVKKSNGDISISQLSLGATFIGRVKKL